MAVLAVIGIALAAAAPGMVRGVDHARAVAAARHLGQLCASARFHAVAQGRYVAIRFSRSGDDYLARMYADGNRNGVRTADADAGIDAPIGAGVTLSALFAGARVGLDPSIGLGTDPLRLGGTTLLSFSPLGTATAGSIYVLGRDGTQLVVRVLGATGRTRVLRYERSTDTWVQP